MYKPIKIGCTNNQIVKYQTILKNHVNAEARELWNDKLIKKYIYNVFLKLYFNEHVKP